MSISSAWNTIWLTLSRFIETILKILGMQNLEDKNKMRINVKFSSSPCVPLDTDPKWSVAEFKQRLSDKTGIPFSDIKLIFAGKELDSSLIIEEFDLGNQSIIHAVHALKPASAAAKSSAEDTTTQLLEKCVLSSPGGSRETCEAPERKAGFYVYCSSPCKSIQRGKLRVRCNICKQGTLTVSRDPCHWDDVLIPGRINGTCQLENCEGNVAEFYFKCANHPSCQDDWSVALYLIRSNIQNVVCLACTDINDPVVVFECESSHVMCVDCFRLYCLSRLNERQFVQDEEYGYTLPCPAGCAKSLIKETHHFRVLEQDQYDRYQRFGAEECLLQAGGVLCPVPGCGAGILPDLDCRRIVCLPQGGQGCGFVFCRNCSQGFHVGDCQEAGQTMGEAMVAFTVDPSQVTNSRWNVAGQSSVQVMTKPCPKCRTPTERDGGCMHMVCVRPQCGFNWCWVCQTEWTRDCMGSHWFG